MGTSVLSTWGGQSGRSGEDGRTDGRVNQFTLKCKFSFLYFNYLNRDQEKKGKAYLVFCLAYLIFCLAYLVFSLEYLVFCLAYLVFWLVYLVFDDLFGVYYIFFGVIGICGIGMLYLLHLEFWMAHLFSSQNMFLFSE